MTVEDERYRASHALHSGQQPHPPLNLDIQGSPSSGLRFSDNTLYPDFSLALFLSIRNNLALNYSTSFVHGPQTKDPIQIEVNVSVLR